MLFMMLATIDLYNQLCVFTQKVSNISSNRNLPSEL